MTNVNSRLLLFFIGFPVILCSIIVFPFSNLLLFNLMTVAVSGIAGWELAGMFAHRGIKVRPCIGAILAAMLPLLGYGIETKLLPEGIFLQSVAVIFCILFASRIFAKNEAEFPIILPKVSAYTFILVYPGFFASYVSRISVLKDAPILLTVFILAVYLNDSFAWASGMLWGKGSRKLIPISPNKSLIGFAFGFATSIVVFLVADSLFPGLFPGMTGTIIIGALIGLSAIIGDLFESALKRSAILKDSGDIIPGRGGLLDSIDSPLFSLPVFYYAYIFITNMNW